MAKGALPSERGRSAGSWTQRRRAGWDALKVHVCGMVKAKAPWPDLRRLTERVLVTTDR